MKKFLGLIAVCLMVFGVVFAASADSGFYVEFDQEYIPITTGFLPTLDATLGWEFVASQSSADGTGDFLVEGGLYTNDANLFSLQDNPIFGGTLNFKWADTLAADFSSSIEINARHLYQLGEILFDKWNLNSSLTWYPTAYSQISAGINFEYLSARVWKATPFLKGRFDW